MAACVKDAPREVVDIGTAQKRFVELMQRHDQLLELLRSYTPDELISHLRACEVAKLPYFSKIASLAEQHTPEEIAASFSLLEPRSAEADKFPALAEVMFSHSVQEVLTAVDGRDKRIQYLRKYQDEHRPDVRKHNSKYVKKQRSAPAKIPTASPVC